MKVINYINKLMLQIVEYTKMFYPQFHQSFQLGGSVGVINIVKKGLASMVSSAPNSNIAQA